MEAALLKLRLGAAVRTKQPIVLLLRGAHTLEIVGGSLDVANSNGPFDITGLIAIDGSVPREGTVMVIHENVVSLFVEHEKDTA